eukprot:TRINITY_DN1627_c0_g6_i1.p1 TRINITY_DN1627_c0_g6~~TRINITY_DN1627_c0_g6_i1.p1  ORF type:complete len:289 (+),score=138.57 TRINITY_DN1627_c0_g6_i1:171-1037(+)
MIGLIAFVIFTLIVGLIAYFLLRKDGKNDPKEVNTEVQRGRSLGGRGRLHVEEDEESEEEKDDQINESLSKKEMAKLLKKREREEQRRAVEAERAEHEARAEQKRSQQSEKYRKREEERLARELEEKKREEEERKKEEEEYDKWKTDFAVEDTGAEANDDENETQSKLAEFINYIVSHKVVSLNDLAAEFSIPTAEVVSRIKDLEKNDRLTGIMDDRGKYIFITLQEFKSIADYIRKVGRVNKADLVRECNKLVKLTPEDVDQKKLRDEVAAMEKEVEMEEQAGNKSS